MNTSVLLFVVFFGILLLSCRFHLDGGTCTTFLCLVSIHLRNSSVKGESGDSSKGRKNTDLALSSCASCSKGVLSSADRAFHREAASFMMSVLAIPGISSLICDRILEQK